jgi:hypothetical protein
MWPTIQGISQKYHCCPDLSATLSDCYSESWTEWHLVWERSESEHVLKAWICISSISQLSSIWSTQWQILVQHWTRMYHILNLSTENTWNNSTIIFYSSSLQSQNMKYEYPYFQINEWRGLCVSVKIARMCSEWHQPEWIQEADPVLVPHCTLFPS